MSTRAEVHAYFIRTGKLSPISSAQAIVSHKEVCKRMEAKGISQDELPHWDVDPVPEPAPAPEPEPKVPAK